MIRKSQSESCWVALATREPFAARTHYIGPSLFPHDLNRKSPQFFVNACRNNIFQFRLRRRHPIKRIAVLRLPFSGRPGMISRADRKGVEPGPTNLFRNTSSRLFFGCASGTKALHQANAQSAKL
ncbi:MAG: hypothetical protein WGN25_14875 [Candidatus Electrothrix sp. GW3-4]|uniref:hypothetical protein n=1 Tax=Candidatus Electrothrix sp. GW3-4 TaxID=3126740 RepID=UPI0030D3FF80